jgi:O-antigen/teichoic acid export membrane protein
MLLGQIVGKGAVFVSMMLISRHMGDIWFGRLLLAVILSVFSCFITDFGAAILVNRRISLGTPEQSRDIWRSALGFRTVMALVSLIALTAFSLLSYPLPQTIILIPILLGMTLEIMAELPFASFRALGQTRREASARISSSVVFLLLVVVFIGLDAHPYVVAAVFLVRGAAMAWVSFRTAGKLGFDIHPCFSPLRMLGLLKETWPLGLMGIVAIMHQRVDNLVIERTLGVVSVGAYNEIYKVLEVLVLIITPTLLPGALFPGLCRAFRDGSSAMAIRRIAYLISALSAVVVALMLPPGEIFMKTLWGDAFLRGLSPAEFDNTRLLLFSGIPVFFFMNFLLAAVIAMGRQKATLPAVTAGLLASLALNLWLMGNHGLPAAGVAAVFSSALVGVVCASLLGRGTLRGLIVPFVLGVLPASGILILQGFTGLPWPLLTGAGFVMALPALLMAHRQGWSLRAAIPSEAPQR